MNETLPNRTPVYLYTFTPYGYLPLALGMIQAYMASYGNGSLGRRIEFVSLYNMEPDRILEIAEKKEQVSGFFPITPGARISVLRYRNG